VISLIGSLGTPARSDANLKPLKPGRGSNPGNSKLAQLFRTASPCRPRHERPAVYSDGGQIVCYEYPLCNERFFQSLEISG
jgi:hypothetical protein